MPKIKYYINGEEFKTKKALLAKIRAIRDNAVSFKSLGDDDFSFMIDVLKLHHGSAQKIGCGINSIYVRNHPEYYQTRGFWAERADGTHVNFSFLECLKKQSSRLAEFKKICRLTIDQVTLGVKMQFLDDNPNLPFEDYCVHHAGRESFDRIVMDFIKERQIDVNATRVHDSPTGKDGFENQSLADDFIEFHNRRATLMVISTKEHRDIHGAKK